MSADRKPRGSSASTAAPWWLYGPLLAFALLAATVAAYVAWSRGTKMSDASPAANQADAASKPTTASHAAVLSGYVTDAETRVPLADVRLTIEDWDTRDGGTPTATTDAAGRFRFGDLHPSDEPMRQVRLIATKPGYSASTTDPPLGATDHPIKLRPLAPRENRP